MNIDITATDFLKTATNTAEHFGFINASALKKNPRCKACTTKFSHSASANDRKQDALHGMLTAGINVFADYKLHALEEDPREPVLYYSTEQVPRSGDAAITLQVFGAKKSIAEILLIQASRALITELGFENHTIRINSLGDKDSSARYIRELTNYFQKRMDEMPPAARELMKDHAFSTLMHLIEKDHEMAQKSPNPLEYLTDSSRKHFREIVEYLDMCEAPYEIDPKLIGHHQCYSDALFAIDIHENDGEKATHAPVYVRGGRYNVFMEKHTKMETYAAGAVIVLRDKKAPQRIPRSTRETNPSVYIVQLGFCPKIKSLLLIDELRKEGIAVHQDLTSDSLSAQLRDAEERGVKHTIIIGQKEFVEDIVILRDMKARSQEQISTAALIGRLKRTGAVA